MKRERDAAGHEQIWSIALTLLEDLKEVYKDKTEATFHFPHGANQISLREAGYDACFKSILPFFRQLLRRSNSGAPNAAGDGASAAGPHSKLGISEIADKSGLAQHEDTVREIVAAVCDLA